MDNFCLAPPASATLSLMAKRKVFWADTRFFIGVVLILGSVAGVWGVVAGARETVPVFVASGPIVPGQPLDEADLAIVEASLGMADARYVAAGESLDGLVAQRTIGEGELVPQAAVGETTETTTVVIDAASDVPSGVGTGSPVELWSAPATEDGFDTPRILVPDATVAQIVQDAAMMAQDDTRIEIVLRRAVVAEVLEADASGAALSIVPVGSAE